MINFEDWYRERMKAKIFTANPYPRRPFRSDNWIGVAFNRDKNKLCAPDYFWRAILSEAKERLGENLVFCVGANDLPDGVSVAGGANFENSYEKLSDFLLTDNAYLSMMYISGGSERWAYWGGSGFLNIRRGL